MNLLRHAGLLLSALWLAACGGSQKAPDAVASHPAPAASAAASEPSAGKPEAVSKATEAEAEAVSTGPECKKDDECTIFADCCSCKAVLASKPLLVPCESVCGESKCEVKEMTIANVACDSGRCVLKKKK